MNATQKPHDTLQILEQIFTTYVLAIRSRSGNIVGRVLRNRSQADETSVNELYNILLEDCNKIQAAAEVSVDVLFVAFENFMQGPWQERIGPIIPFQTLDVMQEKFDTLFPGDFEDFFRKFLTDMSPQTRRALTSLIKLLAELLDASGNDGDRGALTATFAEFLTESGDPMTHVSLLDRLVEDFDRLFAEHLGLQAPFEGSHVHSNQGTLSRGNSVNTGSMSSNTSSFRKRFGFGFNKENGKPEGEGKVTSIIRTLSKSKGSEPDSPASSISKGTRFRSRSTDTDSRLASFLRPNSRDRLQVQSVLSAEDQTLRPNSAHSNAPTLASIGEDHSSCGQVKKKRRSSLSDLKPLESTPVTPIQSPHSQKPLPSPNHTLPSEPSSPTRQPRPTSSGTHQSSKSNTSSSHIPSPVRNSTTSVRKENVPITSAQETNGEKPPNKAVSAINSRYASRKRAETLPHSQPSKATGLKERTTMPNASETQNSRPQTANSTQSPHKLRMQNPQKVSFSACSIYKINSILLLLTSL